MSTESDKYRLRGIPLYDENKFNIEKSLNMLINIVAW